MGKVILLLEKWQKGDLAARNRAFEIVYETLKQIAVRKRQNRVGELILQPTVLVNEVFIKLANQQQLNITDRQHFLAIAAKVIFQIIRKLAVVRHKIGKLFACQLGQPLCHNFASLPMGYYSPK